MSRVNVVKTDAEFNKAKSDAKGKTMVIDFSAKWCGPCNTIAPKFNALSNQFVDLVFLKVDVDLCPNTAATYNVSSMPTFIFEKDGNIMDRLKGADPVALTTKIEAIQNMVGTSTTIMGGEMVSLTTLMTSKTCLNESEDHPLKWAFEDNDSLYLESDCDPELLMSFAFSQNVKLHSIKVKGPADGSAPKSLKLFINQPALMDFDGARDSVPLQELELSEEDVANGTVLPLKFVKLQNVSNVTLFFGDNQKDEETTKIQSIVLYGKPVNTTNMKDFQRVSGKAGEAH